MKALAWGMVGAWLVAASAPAEEAKTRAASVRTADPADEMPYDPTGRRDPFRPPTAGPVRHAGEPRTPLQGYEVGQLKLVAIIYDTRDPRAVLEDEAGLGYIVKVGTPVGLNEGRVRTIERGRVVIEESSVDFYGETHPSEVVLELRASERGKR